MTKINIKNKKKLKTKKQINKLKGGCKDESKHNRILRLIKFICSLEQKIPDLSYTMNKGYGTNYPFTITYYDLKIILLYITFHSYFLKNNKLYKLNYEHLSILKTYNIDNLSTNVDKKLKEIYKLINDLCFEDKDLNKNLSHFSMINNVEQEPNICIEYPHHKKFNFEFFNDSQYKDEKYENFKKYLESNFYNIYYLFYDKMIKIQIKRKTQNNNTNSGYTSNSSIYNNAIGVNSKNTKFNSNNVNNEKGYKPRGASIYGRIRKHFFNTYQKIFNEDGKLIDNDKLLENIRNLLKPKID